MAELLSRRDEGTRRTRRCGLGGICAILLVGLLLPSVARAKTFAQIRSEVRSWHLNPAPLFPRRLPAGHRHVPIALDRWRGIDFDIEFGAPDGRDCHTLPNPHAWCVGFRRFTGHSVLKAMLHSRSIRNPRRVRVGKRTVWFFRSETDANGCWMAWDEHGRTYGAWAFINQRRRALRRLKPFVRSLRLLTSRYVTRTYVYRAFNANGNPSIHVTNSVRGYCWSGSEAIDRADAWRCRSGNYLYDPCFSSANRAGIVLCPAAAWLRSGTEIQLTKRLPHKYGHKHKPSVSGLPWGIETTSGTKCLFLTGATSVFQHRRANYGCRSGEILYGSPDRHGQPWTIHAGRTHPRKLHTVAIEVAWY
jgi:hypothetical protein